MEIIIIDDESAALNTFLHTVTDNAEVKYAMFRNEPLAALDYVSKNDVSAAFLDICMPQINGVDLAERLIAKNRELLIVFITGYAQNETEITARLGSNVLGFCNKPFEKAELLGYLEIIKEASLKKRVVSVRAFGCFDLFINDYPVKFPYSKSKELFALLVDKNGANLTKTEAISLLWADENITIADKKYRDALYRLRVTLNNHNLTDLLISEKQSVAVNKQKIASCDYWDFLNGKNNAYCGSYMPNYDWSIDTQMYLDNI